MLCRCAVAVNAVSRTILVDVGDPWALISDAESGATNRFSMQQQGIVARRSRQCKQRSAVYRTLFDAVHLTELRVEIQNIADTSREARQGARVCECNVYIAGWDCFALHTEVSIQRNCRSIGRDGPTVRHCWSSLRCLKGVLSPVRACTYA